LRSAGTRSFIADRATVALRAAVRLVAHTLEDVMGSASVVAQRRARRYSMAWIDETP
jgi:hypothetical protein